MSTNAGQNRCRAAYPGGRVVTAATVCGKRDPRGLYVCGKPTGHDGAHVAILPNGAVAWGGMT